MLSIDRQGIREGRLFVKNVPENAPGLRMTKNGSVLKVKIGLRNQGAISGMFFGNANPGQYLLIHHTGTDS